MRRAKLPLDPLGVRTADEAFYAQHPELVNPDGTRRKLTMAPADAALRKEWMEAYSAAGGAITAPSSTSPVGSPTMPCSASPSASASLPTSIIYEGTLAEQQQLRNFIEKIHNAGPKGKHFIESLENSPNKTCFFIGTSAIRKDGTVIPLASTGGGVTLRPTESTSGDNEVYIDPTNLIDYTATDGTIVTETPEGLLLHEAGHAALLNTGDLAQTTGGSAAEANVRAATNDIRQELGMKPEH